MINFLYAKPNLFINTDIQYCLLQLMVCLQRCNNYKYVNLPAFKKYLDHLPIKKLLLNWNNVDIDLKSNSDSLEFKILFQENKIASYNFKTEYFGNCFTSI